MRIRNKSIFRIYKSAAYDYVRLILIGMPVLCCWLANNTKQLWIYGIAVLAAIVTVYVLNLFSARLVLDPNGIILIRNFQHTNISWDKIVFAEIIAMLPYGFSFPVEILCFSTQKQNPAIIRKSKYLPHLSKDFVFIILNNQMRREIVDQVPKDVAKRLKINLWGTDGHKQAFQTSARNKWIGLCVIYLFALLFAYILIQFNQH